MIDALKGPCLLDLADLMQTSVETLSEIFVMSTVAQIIGSFSCKYTCAEFCVIFSEDSDIEEFKMNDQKLNRGFDLSLMCHFTYRWLPSS